MIPRIFDMQLPTSLRKREFETLAIPHLSALLRTALRLCGDRQTGEDLVQETMLRAWKSFDRFQPGNCKAWLFAIMFRLWNRERHKIVKRGETGLQLKAGDLATTNSVPAPEQLVFLRQVLVRIDQLPMPQRTVLLLSVVEGFSVAEVASVLRLRQGTVMSRLARARSNLRELMHLLESSKEHSGTGKCRPRSSTRINLPGMVRVEGTPSFPMDCDYGSFSKAESG